MEPFAYMRESQKALIFLRSFYQGPGPVRVKYLARDVDQEWGIFGAAQVTNFLWRV